MRIKWITAAAVITATGTVQAMDLLTAYRQAAESSPLVAQARARLQAEQYGKDIARSALAPRVTAEGSINRSDLDLEGFGATTINENYNPSAYSVTLTQPLLSASAWSSFQAARSKAESYEAALLAVQQDLILQTADTYFSVLRTDALERTALSQQTLLQKIKDRAESELRAGTGDIIAVEEARARLSGAESELLSARNSAQIARRALERLTHKPVEALTDLKSLEPQGPVPDRMEDWVKSAIDSQPVLEQARRDLQANRYLISAADRKRWPVVSLNAQYNYANGTLAPDIDRREGLVGVSAVWPLFQGGEIRASKARAAALAQVSEYGLEALKDNVRLDTQRSFLNLENSVAQLDAARRTLESADTALKATRKGYETGSRSVVEVLDSAQRQANAASDYYLALYNQILSRMQLKASAGVLSENDVDAISQLLSP